MRVFLLVSFKALRLSVLNQFRKAMTAVSKVTNAFLLLGAFTFSHSFFSGAIHPSILRMFKTIPWLRARPVNVTDSIELVVLDVLSFHFRIFVNVLLLFVSSMHVSHSCFRRLGPQSSKGWEYP
jgi:hypothetical protein